VIVEQASWGRDVCFFYCLSWGSKHVERSFDGVPYSWRKVLVPIKDL
jgi:hypothetical protein